MYNSISTYDWQIFLTMIEALAWVAVLGVGLELLTRAKAVTKQNRQIILLLFAAWAVASLGLAGIKTYSYFHSQRSSIVQSIEAEKQQYGH